MSKKDFSLVYIMDAYCGWCYGFSNSISTFHKNHPAIEIEVISGGLFIGKRSGAIRNYPHIPEANKKISEMTGAIFGEGYQELLRDGSTITNSEEAAVAFSALCAMDSTRGVEFIAAMQHAFYFEGKNLSETTTITEIAEKFGLDANQVSELLKEKATLALAHADFAKAQELKVNGYPTLLLKQGESYTYLGGSLLKPEEIEAKIHELTI